MRTGLLLGREHELLDAVASVSEGPVAIALSRGGAPKTYDHRDPNEDACAFASTEHAVMLAVADGHWGAGGAACVLERLLAEHAKRWTAPNAIALAERWWDEAPEVVDDLQQHLLRSSDPQPIGRTTLSLCVARPEEGWLLGLAVGDSHLFRIEDDRARELCPLPARSDLRFLGDATLDRDALSKGIRAVVERDVSGGALLLATDGLSETGIGVHDPVGAAAECAVAAEHAPNALRSLEGARCLLERAMDAHRTNAAGDNIATAAFWWGA
ncbi:MAG: protein phosphatase 2C domain-containing protein [Myxococcota bacterium]